MPNIKKIKESGATYKELIYCAQKKLSILNGSCKTKECGASHTKIQTHLNNALTAPTKAGASKELASATLTIVNLPSKCPYHYVLSARERPYFEELQNNMAMDSLLASK